MAKSHKIRRQQEFYLNQLIIRKNVESGYAIKYNIEVLCFISTAGVQLKQDAGEERGGVASN
jgi:hypothetical protein